MQAKQQPHMEARAMQEPSLVPGTLDLSVLEACCRNGIENDYLADPAYARFSIALLRRATTQDNQQAWEGWQQCTASVLRSWLRRHPRAEEACFLSSEEGYLTQTFERFRQVMTAGQLPANTELSTMLRYLLACLNGVLLDALRSKAGPQDIPLQELASVVKQAGENQPNAHRVWVRIQDLFPDVREQQVVYLLFDCHLGQEEIF